MNASQVEWFTLIMTSSIFSLINSASSQQSSIFIIPTNGVYIDVNHGEEWGKSVQMIQTCFRRIESSVWTNLESSLIPSHNSSFESNYYYFCYWKRKISVRTHRPGAVHRIWSIEMNPERRRNFDDKTPIIFIMIDGWISASYAHH